MKNKKVTQLTPKQLEGAKEMYLSYHSVTEIASKYSLARTSVSYHANKYWKVDRELAKAELFQHFTSTKKAHFTRMSENAMKIIDKSLANMASKAEGATPAELGKIAQVLESLDKITRLDDGRPTEITEEKPFAIDVLHEKIRLDPFADVPEIEFKEVKEDEKDI